VGSITPSSPELARRMVAGIRPNEDNVLLELGVGTGAITKFLQEIVPDENSYLGIELDRDLRPEPQEELSGYEDRLR
jgi:phosphatidylethanolamine/phosphatidyl-N-methylethanolamine N-methyltransferase